VSRQSPNRDTALPVQRVRLRYAKRGRLRFSSARDFQRALERALRRADIPMAYSGGFSPHPRISYANAAATGVASEAEYVELALVERCDPTAVRVALDAALPPGLDVVDAVEAATSDFAVRLEASVWQIELPGVEFDAARAAVAAFLAEPEVLVERMTKSGRRTFDARAAVTWFTVCEPDAPGRAVAEDGRAEPCAILALVVRHGTPSVRPDDVLSALHRVAALVPPKPPRVTRLAQGPLDAAGASVADPLGPDRAGLQP
jgi:radical SAM-linked protein